MIDRYMVGSNVVRTDNCHYCEHLKLIDMLDEALLFIKADDCKIIYMNEKARSIYGFGDDEALNLKMADIACDPETEIANRLAALQSGVSKKNVYTTMHRKKNGQMLTVEVNTQFIRLHGEDIYVTLIRDMTVDLLLRADVVRAEKIQRQFLPANINHKKLLMRAVYKPHGHISGDLYGYSWQKSGTKLLGYLIDVMGHGVATALQAATVRVLFEQAAEMDMPLHEKMTWLNKNALPYFVEDSFAAAICFEIDFETYTLTCCTGGINHFIVILDDRIEIISLPGSFLGLTLDATFETFNIDFHSGDSFFFLSDGLLDLLPQNSGLVATDFAKTYHELAKLAASDACRDDATAMCFYIK